MSVMDVLRSQGRLAVLSWGGVGLLRLAEYSMDRSEAVRSRANEWLMGSSFSMEEAPKALPILAKALEHDDKNTRKAAGEALANIAWLQGDSNPHIIKPALPALIKILTEDDEEDVRKNAAKALGNFVKNCKSIETLEKNQGEIENYHGEWKGKQPQGRTKERIDRELQTSKLLMQISEIKARLSKGELLLGDTVKKPSGRKIYRNLRQVSRNGCQQESAQKRFNTARKSVAS